MSFSYAKGSELISPLDETVLPYPGLSKMAYNLGLWYDNGEFNARLAYQALRPIVLVKDKDLADELDAEFTAIQTELDKYKTADGFQYYDQLTPDQVKQLSDAVNALSEPLSQLTAVVVL